MPQPILTLTFDDGPHGAQTRQIVDILAAKRLPATFFAIGQRATEDPATLAYVAERGMAIGNHTWDHSFFLPFRSRAAVRDNLERTAKAIATAIGSQPEWFRPPHGWTSPMINGAARDLGLTTVGWSVDPHDYAIGEKETIIRRVLDQVRDGGILLFHDGLHDGPWAKALGDRKGTIAALPEIIDRCQAEGFQFVSLADYIKTAPLNQLRGHLWPV